MSREPLRAALYIRVSTEDQVENSPEAQRKALYAYAKNAGMEIITECIYEDKGKSGRTAEKRPDFMRMISDAKKKPKPFDVILVHKFDRFARNREDSIVYKSMLRKKQGIQVISISESMEENKYSLILESMLEAMAEFFSLNLAEEVKKGMTEKAGRGELQTMAPLGYRAVNNMLEIIEEEAVFIRYIFSQFVEHDTEINVIARQLNSMGCKTKKGNKIGRMEVTYILGNPVYTGKLRWTPSGRNLRGLPCDDTIIVDAKHTPIIEKELYDKASDKLVEMRRIAKPSGRPYSEYSHWLSGLLKCSNCGSTLTYKPHYKSSGFQCRGYANAKCNISHHISVRKIEQAILSELNSALDSNDVTDFRLTVKRADTKEKCDELTIKEKQYTRVTGQLKRASDAYLAEIYTIDEYKAIKDRLEEEMVHLTTEIKALKNDPPQKTTESIDAKFKEKVEGIVDVLTSECKLEDKIKAIKSIVDKIVYDKPNRRIEAYYYDL